MTNNPQNFPKALKKQNQEPRAKSQDRSLFHLYFTTHAEENTTNDPGFFNQVYEVVRLIPYGRVTSYGAIAKYLGSPQSSRMVGWALNSYHHLPEIIPAHRVVNRNGLLTGKMHFGGNKTMQQLLENEGIIIENDKIVHFKKLFWDPEKELNI